VASMEVRSADPAAQHLQHDLAGARPNLGHVGHLELCLTAEDGLHIEAVSRRRLVWLS